MSKIAVERNTLDTDVLIVGGGIGGLMAAISAAEQGADVLVAEKANTKRSGCGATGNDHFQCYIPEIHGNDMAPILLACVNGSTKSRLTQWSNGRQYDEYHECLCGASCSPRATGPSMALGNC